ncbi:glycosyl hydrolase [Flavobacterium sediminis]|uniref:glycosyl hydrolase n=1 Tax=Flavobacterium sediminis TaxID=2201181 RepID=UPI001FE325FD|nr:glycosyl hydrolase [Flavobacterium sediminis]
MRLYKTIQKITLLTSISLLASCHSILNSDQQATTETQNVYRNLIQLKQKGFMFGHQDDLAYGVNWKYENGRSDVKEVANDYPAVYGWDIGRIENDSPENLDGVPFHKMRQYIKEVYQRAVSILLVGILITLLPVVMLGIQLPAP